MCARASCCLQLDDADIRTQAARAQAQVKTAQADQSALKTGGTQEEVLTLNSQLVKGPQRARSGPAQSRCLAPPAAGGCGIPGRGSAGRRRAAARAGRRDSARAETEGPLLPAGSREDRRRRRPRRRPPTTPRKTRSRKSSVRAPFDGIGLFSSREAGSVRSGRRVAACRKPTCRTSWFARSSTNPMSAACSMGRKSKSPGTQFPAVPGPAPSTPFRRPSNCAAPEMSARRPASSTTTTFACCPTSTSASPSSSPSTAMFSPCNATLCASMTASLTSTASSTIISSARRSNFRCRI